MLLSTSLMSCGFLKRPKNQFYSLDTIAGQGPVANVAGAPLAIDAIELPPGLDRRGIFIRGADSKVEVRGTHQWTAPLEDMVMHTLAFNLANRMPEGMVILPGQEIPATPSRSLSVVFEELAPGPDPVFVLDARWTISERPGVTHHERITVPMSSMESPQIVAAMNQSLATLSDRIVAQLSSSGIR
ncbi:MAG: membrane integrity-associated transporter subunit PqiC [Thermoanaerobaculia bacterium]